MPKWNDRVYSEVVGIDLGLSPSFIIDEKLESQRDRGVRRVTPHTNLYWHIGHPHSASGHSTVHRKTASVRKSADLPC